MKKTILYLLTLISLTCCSSSDSPAVDPIVGKWFIYKTVYETDGNINAVYNYDIHEQCGAESLEVSSANNYIVETYYTNEDCTGFSATGGWYWSNEDDGNYNIFQSGQTIPQRNAVLNGDDLIVTEPDNITVVKYYKKVD
ncbi:MAG: hypothetical protein RL427_178 [Bacteroidota bacterium]|jgi:hypothetical protein